MTPPDKNKAGSPPEPPTLERTLEPATSGGPIVGADQFCFMVTGCVGHCLMSI